MLIGVARIVMDFYNNESLHKKRESIDSLCHDIKKKFNVSMLEVADFDDLERCVIGFAAVLPENWKAQRAGDFVQNICKTIDETAFARVTVEDWDILEHGISK